MHGETQKAAYDRGSTIFSPDGRLYQVEYAREAVKRGSASVGVRTQAGVVLVANKPLRSPLLVPASIEKIHEIDRHVAVASAGHVADARQLVDFARRAAQRNRLRYGEPVGVETLSKAVADHVQEHTQTGGARPFGVGLLVGGSVDGEPKLYETDPSGTPSEWQAAAIGSNRNEIQNYLEANYEIGLDLDGGIDLALRALAAPVDGGLTPEQIDVATIGIERQRFDRLDGDKRRSSLDENGLLSDES